MDKKIGFIFRRMSFIKWLAFIHRGNTSFLTTTEQVIRIALDHNIKKLRIRVEGGGDFS
jgi:hypothetical protein